MDYELTKNYWKERDPQGKKLAREKLLPLIEKFIAAHNVMGLATACGSLVRNTPVEYEYFDGAFWFLSEGGQKFAGLEVNKNVCLAIFDQMTKGVCRGLQVTGTASVIEPESSEYAAYFNYRNLPQDTFAGRTPYPMPMLKVMVKEFDYFDWALAKMGCHMRQHLDM